MLIKLVGTVQNSSVMIVGIASCQEAYICEFIICDLLCSVNAQKWLYFQRKRFDQIDRFHIEVIDLFPSLAFVL